MSTLEWRAPAGGRAPWTDWTKVIAELKTKPGEWACVGVYASGVTSHLKKRYPGVEATMRHVNMDSTRREGELFVRWVGVA